MAERILEIKLLNKKFKTVLGLQQQLPGRFGDRRPITLKTLYKYIQRGMPCFEFGGRILFSEEDLAQIPDWISKNCRTPKNRGMSL